MGFEQLASLKQQLTQQAQAAKQQTAVQATAAKPAAAKPTAAKHGKTRPNAAKPKQPPREAVDPVILTIGALQKRFPAVFPKSPLPKIPLKLKIHQDLLAQAPQLGLTEQVLLDAIKTWCQGTRYWACLVTDAVRVDLTGTAAGQVLPGEAARARVLEAQRYRKKPQQKAPVLNSVTQSADLSTVCVEKPVDNPDVVQVSD